MQQNFPLRGAIEAGFDLGASLIKMAVRDQDRAVHYASFPIEHESAIFERVAGVATLRGAAITGAGAGRAAERLSGTGTVQIGEFDAWARGARALLRHHGRPIAAPFLLVSVGTGTPILRVEENRVKHVGGSPLGGGCAMVLGASLAGSGSFQELTALAAQGDRRNVDLLLRDLYAPSDTPLPLEATASHLGKLRRQPGLGDTRRADLCDAIWGLVGDNLGLLCGAIAGREQIEQVIVGGSTVQDNPSLQRSLGGMLKAHGLDPHFLKDGAHTGARGALEVLRARSP